MSVLTVSSLSAGYRGRPVLDNVTLHPLRAGGITALVGPNAAGKSTLLRAIAGLIPVCGTIDLDGMDLAGLSLRQRARKVAFMPQRLPDGIALTVLESLLGALRASAIDDVPFSSKVASRRAMEVLSRLGLGHLALEQLDRLSGGQRQMVGLAQALVRQPKLLLLDEPTSALDLRHQFEVMEVVQGLAREGRIVVVVLHDLALAARWASQIVVLGEGRVRSQGAPEEAITADVLGSVYKVDATVTAGVGGLQIFVDRPLL